jgi:hypothetical protein
MQEDLAQGWLIVNKENGEQAWIHATRNYPTGEYKLE